MYFISLFCIVLYWILLYCIGLDWILFDCSTQYYVLFIFVSVFVFFLICFHADLLCASQQYSIFFIWLHTLQENDKRRGLRSNTDRDLPWGGGGHYRPPLPLGPLHPLHFPGRGGEADPPPRGNTGLFGRKDGGRGAEQLQIARDSVCAPGQADGRNVLWFYSGTIQTD
jgi:hypothetical protein